MIASAKLLEIVRKFPGENGHIGLQEPGAEPRGRQVVTVPAKQLPSLRWKQLGGILRRRYELAASFHRHEAFFSP